MFRTYRHGDKRVMHFAFASLDEFLTHVRAYLEGSPLSMVSMPPRKKERIALYLNTSWRTRAASSRSSTRCCQSALS